MKRILAAGAVAVTAIVMVGGASPASAVWETFENVNDSLSNVVVKHPSVVVTATRGTDYANPKSPTYAYEVNVRGLDAIDAMCTLKKGTVVLKEEPCNRSRMFGFSYNVTESGNYSITTKDEGELASWTFTRPTDSPARLAAAKCVISSASAKADKSGFATVVKVKTNGKCGTTKGASWAYQYSGLADDGTPSFGVGSLAAKNATTLVGYDASSTPHFGKGIKVTVSYVPEAAVANTQVSFVVK